MNGRAALGSLQLPVATLGALTCAGAVSLLLPLLRAASGFPAGLAIVVLYVLALGGFIGMTAGLLIPPGDGLGIRFSRHQRMLFGVAGLDAGLSVALPLTLVSVGLPGDLLLGLWVGLTVAAPLVFCVGVGWWVIERGGQLVQPL